MASQMQLDHYLLLTLSDHQLASLEADRHGDSPDAYSRCLNVAGRWAVHGTIHTPLLVWHSSQAVAARAAAERASKARGRSIEVTSRSDTSWIEGREIQLFSVASEAALLGYSPLSEAKGRRLRTEADKLAAFSQVARAASAAPDHEAFSVVSRAASKALRAKFGGGSITSAFAWLAGRAGREALESVLAGEVELSGPLSIQEVAEAVDLAQKAELLQHKGHDPA